MKRFGWGNKKNTAFVIDGISYKMDGDLLILTAPVFDSDERFHYIVFKTIDKKTIEISVVDEHLGAVAK